MINLHRRKSRPDGGYDGGPIQEAVHFERASSMDRADRGLGRKTKKTQKQSGLLGHLCFRTDYLLDALRVPQTLDFGKDLILWP